jgi:elongation factor G
VGVNVFVTDGKEHPVDSKPIAFEVAGREAFKKAVEAANPVLLEPVMSLRVVVPEGNMGDVLGDLNTRRARVQGMDQESGKSIITAEVPLAEVQRYATELRSITGGRGVYGIEFLRYEVVPTHLAQNIIAAHRRELKGEDGEA